MKRKKAGKSRGKRWGRPEKKSPTASKKSKASKVKKLMRLAQKSRKKRV